VYHIKGVKAMFVNGLLIGVYRFITRKFRRKGLMIGFNYEK